MTLDESSIRKVIADWHSATGVGDVETVLSLMSKDVVFLIAGQAPMQSRALFEKNLRALLTTHRIRSSAEVQEIVIANDLAYCWAKLEVEITPKAGGAAVARAGNVFSIFRKQLNGAWLLSRDANLLALKTE